MSAFGACDPQSYNPEEALPQDEASQFGKSTHAITSIEQIIPTPQSVTYGTTYFTLHNGTSYVAAVVIGAKAPQAEVDAAYLIRDQLSRLVGGSIPILKTTDTYSSYSLIVSVGTPGGNSLNGTLVPANSIAIPWQPEGYAIKKVMNGTQATVVLAGREAVGSYYAASSWVQVLSLSSGTARALDVTVLDHPDVRHRAVKSISTAEGRWTYGEVADWQRMLGKTKTNTLAMCYTHQLPWWNPPADYRRSLKDLANFERDHGIISTMEMMNPPLTAQGWPYPSTDAHFNQLVTNANDLIDEGGKQFSYSFDDVPTAMSTPTQDRDTLLRMYNLLMPLEDGLFVTVPKAFYSSDPSLPTSLSGLATGIPNDLDIGWTGHVTWSEFSTAANVSNWTSALGAGNDYRLPWYWHNDIQLQETRPGGTESVPPNYYFTNFRVPFSNSGMAGYIQADIRAYNSSTVLTNMFQPWTEHKIYMIAQADWAWNPDAYVPDVNTFNRSKRFWDNTVANAAFLKTATASSTYPGYPASLAVNGMLSKQTANDFWASASGAGVGAWLKVDLGKSQEMSGIRVTYRAYNGFPYAVPQTVNVYVSNDDVTYTQTVFGSNHVPNKNFAWEQDAYLYDFNATGRYVKLEFPNGPQGSDPFIEVSEVEVVKERLRIPPSINNVSQGKTASASSVLTGYGANLAVDGVLSSTTSTNAWSSTTSAAGAWFQVDFGSVMDLAGTQLTFRQSSTGTAYMVPKTVAFHVSNDATTWTRVLKSSNVPKEGSSYSNTPYYYDARGKGRYLRLTFDEGGQNANYIQISEFRAYTENLARGVVAAASSSYTGYGPSLAVDGITSRQSSNNAWANASGAHVGAWLSVDLGAVKDFRTVRLRFREFPANAAMYVPKTVTIQQSSDNTTWTTLLARSGNVPLEATPYSSQPYEYPVNGSGRYVRVLFEDGAQGNSGLVEISELEVSNNELPQHQEHTRNIAYQKVATASSWFSGAYEPSKAFDGKTSWYTTNNAWASSTSVIGSWLTIDLGASTTITKATVTFRQHWDATLKSANSVPKTITFQTSTDNVNWTTRISKSAVVPAEGSAYSSTPYTYNFTSTSGRYLRLLFEDGSQTGGLINISEVAVYK
jgi:hypothetical protein